jgi:two-component system, OmpR family, sensor histidine kinase VicK
LNSLIKILEFFLSRWGLAHTVEPDVTLQIASPVADSNQRSSAAKRPHRPTPADQGGVDAIAQELRRQHQRAELFAEVTLKIRQSLQLKEILSTTVSEVQRILQADRVLIYQVLPDGTGKAMTEAVLPGFQSILGCEFPEEVFPADYQALYAQGRVQAIADVHDPKSGLADCLVEFVDQFAIQAKLIVPIVLNLNAAPARRKSDRQPILQLNPQFNRQSNSRSNPKLNPRLWGLLIAHHCQAPHQWSEFELELMQQLADQIGIAIAQGELLENLEDIVVVRTAELRQVNLNLQQEIIDRQQAEDSLRRREEQLRLITNALPVLIAYVDAQKRYQFNNQAYADWLGQSPASIQGKHLKQVWGAACYQRMAAGVKQVLGGVVVNYENEIQLIDGSSRSVSVTYIPHQDSNRQKVQGFFALTTDISDRKAIERMKDEFISVVSHELRTPLTSIHSALKILATGRLGSLSSDGQQMLEIADDNTDRLVRLVNNVLDLQRIESGAVTMDRQACNAADLMVQATEAMQAMAQQHQVTLSTEPVAISLWADADYIVQALTNLLSNAIKFSLDDRTVWLTAQRIGTAQIQFEVRDQGPGIPANQLESIFARFHQVDASDARKKGGTGLGLTICRKIIEQHGGTIWAESEVGVGSRFIFTLPTLKVCLEKTNDT